MKKQMLTPVKRIRVDEGGKRQIWHFECECGGNREGRLDKWKEGRFKSCGCVNNSWISNKLIDEKKGMLRLDKIIPEYTPEGRMLGEFSCYCGRYYKGCIKEVWDGKVSNCGCKPSSHYLYSTWSNMISRCYRESSSNFSSYGGSGIVVCDRWKNDFWMFVEDMGYRADGLSIDRINPFGNYELKNCRWASNKFSDLIGKYTG